MRITAKAQLLRAPCYMTPALPWSTPAPSQADDAALGPEWSVAEARLEEPAPSPPARSARSRQRKQPFVLNHAQVRQSYLSDSSKTVSEVAREMGCSQHLVRMALEKMRIPIRPPRGSPSARAKEARRLFLSGWTREAIALQMEVDLERVKRWTSSQAMAVHANRKF